MSSSTKGWWALLCLLLCRLVARHQAHADRSAERPYEFSFNIIDFQHRFEKKDADGLINGEYGFITADGVYHETGYATDKNGDFIITRMRNRKITSLKDAQEIFKDRPEAAKKLVEAISKACSGCKIAKDEDLTKKPEKHVDTSKSLANKLRKENVISMTRPKEDVVKNMMRVAKKLLPQEPGPNRVNDQVLEKMANDLYYRFNYTITTHGHHEDGYRSGRKDGSYQAQSEDGIETRVTYLSNEFGHQPNITFVPRASGAANEDHALKGYLFRWYWS
ncbi:PREDICTED: protein lethal(3)malignant blood neoplasm 1 [Dinoponera quadriceps]|uniref:Protein lethal(3)malignant blood neoplasm 1 n=1 Tax=Dinoponera quadriceps TaxID=609295 RepID=A0A6P3X1H2_DINQU|nr:PREDICTED: protein lethal(3)malignant blood neoplasm 1 [Dinoponera quadriceps]